MAIHDMQALEDYEKAVNCPDWCEGSRCTEHLELGTACHAADILACGEMTSRISQWTGAGEQLIPPTATLWQLGDLAAEAMTATDCRNAAAVLLAAADRLERIGPRS